MAARILDGKAIAAELREELRGEARALADRGHRPGLGVLLVGDNPASRSYVTAKEKACAEIGLHSRETLLPATATRTEILAAVEDFNRDPAVHGILVQLPLPSAAEESDVLQAIRPEKDVDGFHPVNIGRMLTGLPSYWPCTPFGVLQMLKRSGIAVDGAHAVVVGRSNIVGRPLANLLSMKHAFGNATVTLCHTGTRDLAEHTRRADILIAAAGRPRTITADMIKPGAAVIDVGVNRVPDPTRASGFRLVGDVDFEPAAAVAGWITPVPGGVGPMTIALLLHNTVRAAARVADGA
jgi:methylenetetrahydrofolate dehydrogenase (NADP+)/methenyltetrahydrofolate cyclohydrolase